MGFEKSDNDDLLSHLDAFGRLRVSSPHTVLEASFNWDKHPIRWSESTSLGGTVTHNANKASVDLAVTIAINSTAIFQSRQYVFYQPGKSQLVSISGNFVATAANVTKRFGYFDADNGVFFQLSGSTLSVVRRTKVSGSVVDNTTAKSSWNLDKLDGTGDSSITIDITKHQIMVIDFQWEGSGRIRYGFNINGNIVYCHEDKSANVLDVPWCQTGSLPIRAEIVNAVLTAATMYITSCSVICEDKWAPEGILRGMNTGISSINIPSNTAAPLISLRKQSAYVKVPIKIVDIAYTGESNLDVILSIVLNGSLTGASWANVSGVCQKDQAATAISGGTTIYNQYAHISDKALSLADLTVFREVCNSTLGVDASGNSDIISLVVTPIGSSIRSYGSINYRELL